MRFSGALGVFLTVWLLCLLTAGGHLYSPDEEIMFRMTESIATRARLDVAPIVAPDGSTFATRRGTNGLEYAQYGIGNSLAAVPLYWAGAAASKIIPSQTARSWLDFQTQLYVETLGPDRGHELLKRFFVSLTGGLIAAATAALIYLFCRRLSQTRSRDDDHPPYSAPSNANDSLYTNTACWVTAVAYGIGTMALPHARTFFSEPLATFFVLLSFYLLIPAPSAGLSRPRILGAGAAFALALMTRLDSLFAAPGIGLMLLASLPPAPDDSTTNATETDNNPANPVAHLRQWLRTHLTRANILRLALFTLPVALFVLWHFTLNALRFGNPFSSAYADQPEGINFSTPLLAGLYGFTMSIGKSLFLFSPAILLGLFGYARFRRQHPVLTLALTLSVLSIMLVHSKWQNWAGGWCWGPRHIFMVHALLIIPAVAFISRAAPLRRIGIEAILLAAFIVQIYGTSQSFIDYYLLYYRTPYSLPNATVLYGGEDIAPSFIQATATGPDGQRVPYPVTAMPAPISDSIYVPQNSQWYRYAEMWNAGYTDNLWLRLMQRSLGKEQPIE